MAAKVVITNEELIKSFLWVDLGRYLFKLTLKPITVKPLNKVMIEMRVVAIPTLSVL